MTKRNNKIDVRKIEVLPIEINLEKQELSESNYRNKSSQRKIAREMLTYAAIMECRDDIGISGVKHCCNSSVPFFRRILWIVVILGGFGVMTWQMTDRIQYYFEYEVDVSTEINYTNVQEFPAVIFCNHNMFKRSIVQADGYGDILTAMYIYYTTPDFSSVNFTDFNSTEFFVDYAQPLEDLLYVAYWESSTVIPKENFTVNANKFGTCFIFNEDGSFKSSNTGTTSGLTLFLMTGDDESFASKRISSGFQVLAYKPGGVPLVTELGYSASAGFITRIGLQTQETKNIEPPWGVCNDSKELEFYESYSYEACRIECETNYLVSHCGCKMYHMPGNANPCDLQEMYNCGIFYEWLFPSSSESDSCNCPVPCHKLIYKPTISQAKLPSSYYSDFYTRILGTTDDYFNNNFLQIDIYFEEMNIEYISQKPSYDVFALFCDIGGSVGLWVGGSILTIYEVVDIIFNISFRSCNHQ